MPLSFFSWLLLGLTTAILASFNPGWASPPAHASKHPVAHTTARKPVPHPVSKPAAKPASKPTAKPAAKPVGKPVVSPATHATPAASLPPTVAAPVLASPQQTDVKKSSLIPAVVAILPILPPSQTKAFADVALLVANQIAVDLAGQLPGSLVLDPAQSLEILERQGQRGLYDRLTEGVRQGSPPQPLLLKRVLETLSKNQSNGEAIERVIWVQANVDMTQPYTTTDKASLWKRLTTDSLPENAHYLINAQQRITDTANPAWPQLLSVLGSAAINSDRLVGVTASARFRPETQSIFGPAAQSLSAQFWAQTPRSVYGLPELPTKTPTAQVLGKLGLPGAH